MGPYETGQLAGFIVLVAGTWGLWGRRRRIWLAYVAGGLYALAFVMAWITQFQVTQRTPTFSYSNINPVVGVGFGIGLISWMRYRSVVTPVLVVYVFSQLLQAFAWLYWNYGTRSNFNRPLSHLDSLYFALGTLTTAGTGNLSATSDTARAIQTAQMFADLGLVLFALAIVFAKASAQGRLTRDG